MQRTFKLSKITRGEFHKIVSDRYNFMKKKFVRKTGDSIFICCFPIKEIFDRLRVKYGCERDHLITMFQERSLTLFQCSRG